MKIQHLIFGAAAGALMLGSGFAQAALLANGHAGAGDLVSNTASVAYQVGGVSQTAEDSNTVTFLVDRVIDLVVAESNNASEIVVPNTTDQVLTYTVTNNGNSIQDFRLSAISAVNGVVITYNAPSVESRTDTFDAGTPRIFVESGVTPGYDAGDTAIFIDELAPGDTRTVYIVANIADTLANGDISIFTLVATAAQSIDANGQYVATSSTLAADAAQTVGAESATFVETVFGDPAGDAEGARSGSHSDSDAYRVVSALIFVHKYERVVSDPFNGTTNPKRIPGAVVEFCIAIRNTGASSATSIVLTDTLQADLDPTGSVIFSGTVAGSTQPADVGACATIAGNVGGGGFSGQTFTSTAPPSVAAGTTGAVRFTATIR